MKSRWAGIAVVATSIAVVAASAATPKVPRIVSAVMQDADRDARADSVRLTYSTLIRHVRDRDGRYPFAVVGYRIRSIGAASGKVLVVVLVERAQPDPGVRPVIRYRRTRLQPVTLRSGLQAVTQLFRDARAHGNQPPVVAAPPPPPAPPTAPPAPADADADGTLDALDCAPRDKAVHPKAADLPDLDFVDSNCDGIDGSEEDAIFASPKGDDANPGTKAKPKRQIQAAVAAAAGKKKYVLAAAGSYTHVTAATGVGIYGGYDPENWSIRILALVTQITGTPEGVVASAVTDVNLQLLSVKGEAPSSSPGASAYGIRAVDGSSIRLQRVIVTASDGSAGARGANGAAGAPGGDGLAGAIGACDNNVKAPGGAGGTSAVGRDGGKGGDGRYEQSGLDGERGIVGTPGGKGGGDGIAGIPGSGGGLGSSGLPGAASAGGTNSTVRASIVWLGRDGVEGIYGAPGNGGGGGGAGGGQDDFTSINGTGNAGGGGGGGGAGGRGGGGGASGGGSLGLYLHDSTIFVEQSSVTAGDGGAGGRGGDGGPGGAGGRGGPSTRYCPNEIGTGARGGDGGRGGQGGGGGGGAGGPSLGIFKVGTSVAKLKDTKVSFGTAGEGGASGLGGSAPEAQAGIAQAVYP
jgi:hypothetical protein